jgi:hypothetical protein
LVPRRARLGWWTPANGSPFLVFVIFYRNLLRRPPELHQSRAHGCAEFAFAHHPTAARCLLVLP